VDKGGEVCASGRKKEAHTYHAVNPPNPNPNNRNPCPVPCENNYIFLNNLLVFCLFIIYYCY
jgi:hypothetical protein